MRPVTFPGGQELFLLDHRVDPNKLPHSTWEKSYVEAILEHLEWGMTIYDIGAEEGEYTSLWAKHVGAGHVHIIEPAPWYWPNIRAVWETNVQGNPGGTYVGFFAAHGESKPSTEGWPRESRGNPVLESAFASHAEHPHIPSTTIDAYVEASLAPPDVLCIDVEGSEHLALLGGSGVLQEARPEVFMAIHSPAFLEKYHTNQEAIFRLMSSHGYARTLIAEEVHETHYRFSHPENGRG